MEAADLPFEPLPKFVSARQLMLDQLDVLRPPRRMSVSDAAEKFRVLRNSGGGYSGAWRNDQVPYMVEPANMITSREHQAVVFVGPAQSAKTAALIENGTLHSVACDPADVLIVQMSDKMARDYSRRRIDRMIRECDILQRRLDPAADNVFDKQFTGMMLSIGHPTITELSSRSIPRVFLTDYDRFPEDIGDEGSAFDLSVKRTETFASRGITVVESSPGFPVLSARWKRTTPHEAPPTKGTLALYNRGDRRLYYWPCLHCGHYFEGRFEHLSWPEGATPDAASLATVMICPGNGCVIEPRERDEMYRRAMWVPEGMEPTPDGLIGDRPVASIASYWLKGPAARFINWGRLALRYLNAKNEYDRSGSEEALKTTVNIDQGEPYLPKAAEIESSVDAQDLIDRAQDIPLRRVPDWVRFLTASVDVQSNRFEVLVRGWGIGLESLPIARFPIFKIDDSDGGDRLIDPARNAEDWSVLVTEVFHKRYRLQSDETRCMSIAAVSIDSAGQKGVTPNAYTFYRSCRDLGLHKRLVLTKGASQPAAPRVRKTLPDSARKDRQAEARGEIPVYLFNTNVLKDELAAHLERSEPGPFYVHLSRALLSDEPPHIFFEELTAEERGKDGKWKKIRNRNETLDLMVMAHVAALVLKADRIRWEAPPSWATPHDVNVLVGSVNTEQPPPMTPPGSFFRRRRMRSKGI